ncbi:MAG: hypothetical protein ACPGRX_06235, partial [Bdellovibrionales bacterium]
MKNTITIKHLMLFPFAAIILLFIVWILSIALEFAWEFFVLKEPVTFSSYPILLTIIFPNLLILSGIIKEVKKDGFKEFV